MRHDFFLRNIFIFSVNEQIYLEKKKHWGDLPLHHSQKKG
jgi:hypothetical protein